MRVILRSFLTFYSSFIALSLIIDAICIFIIIKGGFVVLPVTFWFRAVVMAIIFYFVDDYKHKEFYYYQNLGVSKRFLWIATYFLDTLLFLSANLIIYLI